MGGAEDFRRQRHGGIDPMALEADIDVAAVFAGDLEPVGEFLWCFAGLQRVQHLPPGRQHQLGAAIQAACGRLQPGAGVRLQGRALVVHFPAQQARQLQQRFGNALERQRQALHRPHGVLTQRVRLGLQRVKHIAVVAAGADMGVDFRQQDFARVHSCEVGRPAAVQARRPAFSRQRAGRQHGIVQRMLRLFVIGDQVFQPFFQSAHARAGAAFGTADPAAQLRHLPARQRSRKAAIGGIEQMMTFVKDVTQPSFGRCVRGLIGG